MVKVFYLNYLGCHSSSAKVDNLFLESSLGLRYVNTISLAIDKINNHIFAIIDGYTGYSARIRPFIHIIIHFLQ